MAQEHHRSLETATRRHFSYTGSLGGALQPIFGRERHHCDRDWRTAAPPVRVTTSLVYVAGCGLLGSSGWTNQHRQGMLTVLSPPPNGASIAVDFSFLPSVAYSPKTTWISRISWPTSSR